MPRNVNCDTLSISLLFIEMLISGGVILLYSQQIYTKFFYGDRYHSGAIIGSLVGASSQYITVYLQYCMLS